MKFDYVPAVDLGDPLTKRLGSYPRVPDLTWDTLRLCSSWLAVTLLRLQYRLTVKGQIPTGDRIAIVANHQSHLDTITLLAALPAKIRCQIVVLAAADYFFCQLNRALAASLLCQAVAFDRLSVMELKQWRSRLKAATSGWILFYPSGSRKSSQLQRGLLKILLKEGWTIVPAHLAGTKAAWSIEARWWKPFQHLEVTFGEPYQGNDLDLLITQLKQDLCL